MKTNMCSGKVAPDLSRCRLTRSILQVLTATVLVTLAMTGRSAETTSDMALAAAEAWSAENMSLVGGCGTPVSVKERRDDGGKLIWYEVAMSGGGCVVVSPDTEIEPIVAVVDRYDGEIPQGHPLEVMLLADMGRRLAVLGEETQRKMTMMAVGASSSSAARSAEVQASAVSASRKWAKLSGNASGNPQAIRLMSTPADVTTPATVVRYLPEWASNRLTYWNQFSTYVPKNYPAGCVATAGAALLQFFNITAAPKVSNVCYVDGASKTLTTKGIDYDWSMLPEENASYGSFTAAQKDIVDRAVYDMGVCLGMAYASDGSAASTYDLAEVLRTKYGFADARYVHSISPNQYEKLIYAQVRCGAPVVLSIQREGGGHAVLAVGYGEDADSTAYTRVFMGWSGSSDAWYALPNVERYSSLAAVVTMIGATSDTLAMRGRVMTESGNAAAYADVTVGGKTVVTDENGYWGTRVTPVAGSLTCSCGGTARSATVGANAATVGSYEASTLASALPDPVDFTVSNADALVVHTNPYSALRAALRAGKILMVLTGYDGCGYCDQLKAQIKGMGNAFSSDFVLFYANTQINSYGLDDETYTGAPYWGTFDPRVWKLENRWSASNGRFTIRTGYSSSVTVSDLNSARRQWEQRNAAPQSFAVSAPDQITIPTALAAKISFPDGTETLVDDGLTWTVVSGTAARITGGGTLTPVEGASGNVTVRCEGFFWNGLYTATKTIRIIDGVIATGLVVDGPDVVDLLKVDGAQYSAKAILSDGSQVEVPVGWEVVEAKATNCTMSAAGYLSFKKNKYAQASAVRVLARYGAFSAAADVTVWGASVKVDKYTLSDNCAWPGKTVTLTIDKVQWWRHGGWEEPTEDFTGVGVHWYYFVGSVNCYQTTSIGTSRTISFTVPPDRNDGSTGIEINLRTSGHSVNDFGLSWMYAYLQYVPAAPSQMVDVTFYGNGGEPDAQTLKYAVGYQYGGFPSVYKKGHYCYWYTTEKGGTEMTTSSNCLASVTRLYAQWSKKYNYTTYNANGGTGTMSASWFYYETPANLRTNAFTKAGAMFAGWSTLPDGPVVYQDGAEFLKTSDDIASVALYAVWVENGYKIVFDANGGTGEMTPQMSRVGTCSSLKPAAFARRGATFAGWSRTPNGRVEFADGGEVCNLATACGQTVTLYAVWNLPDVKRVELTGPDVIDLYDVDTAKFTAVCRLANGATADVAPKWTVEETAVTNAVISSDGLVSFPSPAKYNKASRLRVTAECNGVFASKEVDVWGWTVSLSSWTTPQRVVWPGQTLKIVPRTVTWWRHGVTEEPTDNLDGVEFSIAYGWVRDMYLGNGNVDYGAGGMALQIPSDTSEPDGYCCVYVGTSGTRLGHVITQRVWEYFKYLASAPSRTANVTFVASGGKPATQTSQYAVGYTYDYLPEAVRKGYYCDWYTAAEGGTRVTESSNCLASVTRLYARWSPWYYKISYDANGGTGSMSASWFYYDSPANLRANKFTKSGAVFNGWATSPDGPVVYEDGAEILNLFSSYAQMTLYAVWGTGFYTVEFSANGGTGTMADKMVAVGSCIALPACTFTRTGYSFAGWAETPGGNVKFTGGAQVCDLAASPGARVVLYAVWQGDSYSVTLNRQNGSGGTTSVAAIYGSPMPSIAVPTCSGYVFGGYYTSTDGGGTQYYTASGASARTWDRTVATTLYAYWRSAPAGGGTVSTSNVGFNPNGGTLSGGNFGAKNGTAQTATLTLTYGKGSYNSGMRAARGAGYAFNGFWTAASGGSQIYDANGKYVPNSLCWTSSGTWKHTGNAMLYAQWHTHTVKFDPNGGALSGGNFGAKNGTSQVASLQVTCGSGAYNSGMRATKGGATFNGWWTATSGGSQIYDANGKFVPGSRCWTNDGKWQHHGNAALYARWATSQGYSVTFNPNGGCLYGGNFGAANGTTGPAKITVTLGKGSYNSGMRATRSGYMFIGWWTATSGGSQIYDASGRFKPNSRCWTADGKWQHAGNAALYARWLPISSEGNADWELQADGSWISGGITHSQYTTLKTTVKGAGTLTFHWIVSSEGSDEKEWDYLEWLVDGVRQGKIGGVHEGWSAVSLKIDGTGTHTIQWRYRKDGSESQGEDCGWIRNVYWSGSAQ